MKPSRYNCLAWVATTVLVMSVVSQTRSQSPTASLADDPAKKITHHAKGTFEVAVKPLSLADAGAGELLARMSLDKQFSGGLVGTGKGEMLTAGTAVEGSAGYVAIEKVVGTLDGHKGSFVFQHSGSMNHGALQLLITVVPDSGTEALAGIAGTFKIQIVDGKHSYDFEYTLPQ